MGCVIPLPQPRSKCRLWKLQVSLGRDKLTGKYPRACRNFEGTEKQAKRALYEFERELKLGPVVFDGKTPFGTYAEAWLDEREGQVRSGTLRKNRVHVRNLAKYMGNARMCDIDADMVRHVMDMLETEGGVSGRPLSGTTRQGTFVTLSLILDDAVRDKAIAANPCKEVESRHRPKCDTEEKESLTLAEARDLQAHLMEGAPDPRRVGLMLALNCGLSREEFTGLCWADVDLRSKCIQVKTANTVDEDGLTDTKNGYRRRIIPLDDEVAARLTEWKRVQAETLAAEGIRTSKQTPVVSNPVGELMHPEAFGKWWRRYREKLGLGDYGLHQLRHTYATILCASGTDIITAANLMGHCDTTMLSRVYAHVIPEYARSAAARVGSVLSGDADVAPVPFVIG